MSAYDKDKALLISQGITRMCHEVDASPAEISAAVALALRVELDGEDDKLLRAFYLMNVVKNLTADPKPTVINLLDTHNGG